MKYIYFALDTENMETRKYYPVVCPVLVASSDVISSIKAWSGSNKVVGSLVCATKKQAVEIVTMWRRAHKNNGDLDDLLGIWEHDI